MNLQTAMKELESCGTAYPKGRRSEEKETHDRTEVECDRF